MARSMLMRRTADIYGGYPGQPGAGVAEPSAEELLAQTVYGKREEALGQAEEDRERALGELETQLAKQEEALKLARDKGFLSEEEAQQREVELRESYEAQFDRLARETGEATAGLTRGARTGATREIGIERARAVGGIPGQIGAERMARQREAFGRYGEQVAGARERYGGARAGIIERAQRPYAEIPTGLPPAAMRTAYTGEIRRFQPQRIQIPAPVPRRGGRTTAQARF